MKIDTTLKNQYGKYLVISEDYPYSKNEEDRANLVIIIWNNKHESYSSDGGGTLEIQKIEPNFTIKKNIFGFYNEEIKLPLHLLPNVLKNPAGKLKWNI